MGLSVHQHGCHPKPRGGVIQRSSREVDVGGDQFLGDGRHEGVDGQGSVREAHSLGISGGAAGVDDQGNVLGLGAGRHRTGRGEQPAVPPTVVFEQLHPIGGGVGHCLQVGRPGDGGPGFGIGQLPGDFRRRQAGGDRDRRRPQVGGAQVGVEERQAGGGHDSHPITPAHSHRRQRRGHLSHPPGELSVGQRRSSHYPHGPPVGVQVSRTVQQVGYQCGHDSPNDTALRPGDEINRLRFAIPDWRGAQSRCRPGVLRGWRWRLRRRARSTASGRRV